MIFIDTNIWCYYLDARLPEHEGVVEPVRKALREEAIGTNTVVAVELAHYLSRSLDGAGMREAMETFTSLGNLIIDELDRRLLDDSIDYLARYAASHGLGGRDSTIIASIMRLGATTLYTHDRSLGALATELGKELVDPVQGEPYPDV
ncbi:MAG: type II toxin-antitoxin system VapC family toxin [Candidatus Bathyarchaeota archaeon]|nr:type II toxin-antitoxin system VapC family toxin [Candidatus Bathyarchaeota archaeon]